MPRTPTADWPFDVEVIIGRGPGAPLHAAGLSRRDSHGQTTL